MAANAPRTWGPLRPASRVIDKFNADLRARRMHRIVIAATALAIAIELVAWAVAS